MMAKALETAVKGTSFEKRPESILYLGQSITNEEMWLTRDQVVTHTFISGSTGSGKTELVTNLITNAMAWGSGALFIDGKGDLSTFSKLHVIARALGREDDLLLLNFMKGNLGKDTEFASHTINPFGYLSADDLCQIMSNMLSPGAGDGVMWRERAVSLMTTIINTLAWLRDAHGEPLTISEIRHKLILFNLIRLGERIKEMGAPWNIIAELDFYLKSLPGYQEERSTRQSQTTLDQHGFLSMQWTRMASLLASSYGHILDAPVPDIDITDVILNRRLLVILLPSLERSSTDIRNIGALMVGMIKSMLAQALRTPVEGSWRSVVEDRITNARYPFLILMDEVGQYITDGMGMMAQQARSLNIGLFFATQDFDSLHYNNARETEAIMSNTNTKIFMKAENPTAPQISRVLSTYTMMKANVSTREQQLHIARAAVVRDRLMHLSRRNESLGQQLDDLNNAHLRYVEGTDTPDLSVLLRGFKTGQMICTHGADCIQGVANYIPLEKGGPSKDIALQHFIDIPDYGVEEIERKAVRERAQSISTNLNAEITALKEKELISNDFLLRVMAAFDLAGKPAVVALSKEPPAFPTSAFEGQDPYHVWAHYIAASLLRNVGLIGDDVFAKLRQRDDAQRAEALKPNTFDVQQPFDFLKMIREA
jgi:hypothetical protein